MQPMLLTLLDGTTVFVRPIGPRTSRCSSEGLRRLSPETAFRRFLSPKVSFSAAELRYLTEVDGATTSRSWPSTGRSLRLIAVARCVRTDADTADMAIVVGDPWQGLGLGRALCARTWRGRRAQRHRRGSPARCSPATGRRCG